MDEPSMQPGPATSQLAVLSLVLGILSVLCLGIFSGIPGIITGHIAKSRIRQDPALQGDGLALAGLITSYIGTVFSIIATVFYIAFMVGGGMEMFPALEEILREAQEAQP